MRRVAALLGKELAELRRNPGLFLPAVFTGGIALVMPFFVAVIVPAVTGEALADSRDLQTALALAARTDGASAASAPIPDPEAAVQAWVFQQFLVMLLISPVAAAMSLAAASIVGEKQARTLEPLLATPISTRELLVAKVLGAFLPAAVLGLLGFCLYGVGVLLFARPGVFRLLLTPPTLFVTLGLGPLATLLSLQLAVCVSSRVNDARSAQQLAALVVLPLTGLLLAQLLGAFVLTPPLMATIAGGLAALNIALAWVSVRIFERERILTRWK